MSEQADFEAMVARSLGEWSDSEVRHLGEGQFSVAFVVGSNTVVRFPKHRTAVDSLRVERALVGALRGLLAVALPEPLAERLDLPIGNAFVAHRLVPGVPVSRSMIGALDSPARLRLVAQTADFLTDMSGLSEAALVSSGVRERTIGEIGLDISSQVARELADRLSATQAARAEEEIGSFSSVEGMAPSLCHTDLGGNLVWDRLTERLGVIDWGGSIVSDAVLDLASLSVLGNEFASAVALRTPHLAQRLDDVDSIRATFALQDALHSARQSRWDLVDEVLAAY